MAISPTLRDFIIERDKHQCTYCLTSEYNCGLRMHVDHIIAESQDGPTIPDNLCAACFSCNVHKQDKDHGIDPLTGNLSALFNPNHQRWAEHFSWDESKSQIIGSTALGRATVVTLHMNNPTVVRARKRWVSAGWHPPTE